ncbi:MAG: sigma-70 family RNA polymerase sigma factor [Solirubrobacteraceae bacterium]
MTETLPLTQEKPFVVRELTRATAHPHTLGPHVPAGPRTHRPRRRGRLPAAHERELVLAAREGGAEERDQLVEAFLPLIASIARTYRTSPGIDRNELMQDGVVGLLRALERYDPAQGTPFWAYASWWVRQAMQQLVSELAGPVVLSDRALRQLARIKDVQRRHAQANGTEPSLRELAAETGLPTELVGRLIAAQRNARALEAPAGGDDDSASTLRDLVADPRAEDAFEGVPRRLAAAHLPGLLDRLNERERKIIRARYGLDGREHTLREIAEELGVSAERVRQIEEASMRKLREAVDSPPDHGAHRDLPRRLSKRREVICDAAA